MLGAAVGAEHEDAQVGQPPGHGGGHGRPAEADGLEVRHVLVGAVGMVEQAGDEVRRPAADRQAVDSHQLQHLAGVPDVAQIDRCTFEHRDQECAEHADEVPDRGGGELPAAVGRVVRQQLAGLEAERLMTVDDALGIARRARGERDQCRAGRVGGDGARHRLVGRAGRRSGAHGPGAPARRPRQGRRSARPRTGRG